MSTSLYIHIPFCASKCYYCDFNSYVATSDVYDRYLDALTIDMEGQRQLAGDEKLKTVFIGGGTPTMLDPRQSAKMMELIHRFALDTDVEISIEANPGTVDREKLSVLRDYGVNRISFGVQTLNQTLLHTLGRLHNRDDVFRSYELARNAGFPSINLDLMFGLPDQTEDVWEQTIRELTALNPDHISAYGLKIEEGTPFAVWHDRGQLQLPPEDTEADMYSTLIDSLHSLGYEQYEISNFAKQGHRSRHNQVYWRNEPYLAAGAGAHGYVNGTRFASIKPVPEYIDALQNRGSAREEEHQVSDREAMEDTMMLGLRLMDGVTFSRFQKKHGITMQEIFGQEMARLLSLRLLENDGRRVRLTRNAIPVANEVFMSFIA